MAIVVSAFLGGSVGDAASVSAVDEFSISTRSPRGQTEVRIKGDDDAVKATTRLRLRGGHPIKLDARADKNCADYSNGDLQRFFRAHPCISLYRTLVEYAEGDYVIRFLIATIEMPDYDTAIDLHALLSREGGGNITPLSSNSGKYRNVPFISGTSTTILNGTAVINIQTEAVGRTPGDALLAFLATDVIYSLLGPGIGQ
ncbi:MAG TPA: hypothetical protein VFW64_15665 [Pseudonocardiaceae bacterium]|nr:hypothetical protein [Pseudonocardiaceae bacterium]